MKRPAVLRSALSLVEVVIALGIASTVIVVLVALFGSVFNLKGDTSARREAGIASASLGAFLNRETPFSEVHRWLTDGSKRLVYARFRTNAAGEPDPSGDRVVARWLDGNALPTGLEMAREGRVIRADVAVDTALNPSGPALEPLDASDYSYIAALASISPAGSVDAPEDANGVAFVIPVVIGR